MKKFAIPVIIIMLLFAPLSCSKKETPKTPDANSAKTPVKDKYDPKVEELAFAAQRGDNIAIKEILYNNPRLINASAKNEPNTGFYAIQMAAADNKVGTIRLLLSQGAEVDIKDEKLKRTALHYAAEKGHSETVTLLLESKADPNAKDSMGFTPMHLASLNGHTDTIQILIDNNGDINAADEKGQTPLHWAAFFGRTKVASILIDNKAKIDILNKNSATALDIAISKKEKKFASFLEEKGARKADVIKAEQLKKDTEAQNKKKIEEIKRLGEKDKKGELTPEDMKALKEMMKGNKQ